MVTQTSQASVAERHNEYAEYRWQTADEGAWNQLDEDANSKRAKRYFEDAIQLARAANLSDYRCGSSLAGKAWACYHLVKDKLYADKAEKIHFVDPQPEYESILAIARSALDCFGSAEMPFRYQQRKAELNYLAGIMLIQLCRGLEAEEHFKTAARTFEQLDLPGSQAKARYPVGKLLLCRRRFQEAAEIFREVWKDSHDVSLQTRGFLDYLNVLTWMGYFRQASQLRSWWPEINRDLDRLETPVALAIRFRAALLFAKIDLEIGKPLAAKIQICEASSILSCLDQLAKCAKPDEGSVRLSPLSTYVFHVIAARVAVACRDFQTADEHYQAFRVIEPGFGHPTKGFAELEIIAVDAGCCQCVIECVCTCYLVECHCCCPSVCQQVCFSEEFVSIGKFDFAGLFLAFSKIHNGNVRINRGDLTSAELDLSNGSGELARIIHPDSPTRLDVLAELLRCKRAQKDDSGFQLLLNSALSLSQLVRKGASIPFAGDDGPVIPGPRHPLWIDFHWLAGVERNERGKYEVAMGDFEQAIISAEAMRSATHEKSIRSWLGLIDSKIGLGEYTEAGELIAKTADLQQLVGVCDPIIKNGLQLRCAIMCVLCGQVKHARKKLAALIYAWKRSEESIHGEYAAANRAPVVLWQMIAEIEDSGVDPGIDNEQFRRLMSVYDGQINLYMKLARVEQDTPPETIANQLNLVALQLKSNQRYAASRYLYHHAITLYANLGLTAYQSLVEQNLARLISHIHEKEKEEFE